MLSEAQQDALLTLVEQAEGIEAQIDKLNADKSALYKTAADFALDPKAVKAKVTERRKVRRDPDGVAAALARLDEYQLALDAAERRKASKGSRVPSHQTERETHSAPAAGPANGIVETPSRARARAGDVPHDPATGEIIETESLAAGAPTVPQGQAAGEAITSHADLPAAASDPADQSHLPEREATGAGDAIAPESPPPDFPDMPPFLRRYTHEQLLGAG